MFFSSTIFQNGLKSVTYRVGLPLLKAFQKNNANVLKHWNEKETIFVFIFVTFLQIMKIRGRKICTEDSPRFAKSKFVRIKCTQIQ